jgi:hypothetical protein
VARIQTGARVAANEVYDNELQQLVLRLDCPLNLEAIRTRIYVRTRKKFTTFYHSQSICYFWYPSLDQVPNQMSLCDIITVNKSELV